MTDEKNYTQEEQELLKEASRLTDTAIQKWSSGEYPGTEPLFQRALEIWAKILGPESLEYANGLYNLANLYYVQEHYDKAAELYTRSLSIKEKVLGSEHESLTDNLHWLAETYFANSEYDKAYAPYERVIALKEKTFGPESPEVANALVDIAHLYYYVGRCSESEPYYLRALSIREKAFGAESVEVANCCQRLAILYANADEIGKDPEPYYRRTLSIYQNVCGEVDPYTAQAMYRLARHLAEQGRTEEAGDLYERWFSTLDKIPDISPVDIRWMISGYEDYLREMGLEEKADAVASRWERPDAYEEMQKEYEKKRVTLGPDHPETLVALYHYANARFFEGDVEEAERLHKEILTTRERVLGPEHPDTAQSLYQLSKLMRVTDRYDDAESYILKAMNIQENLAGKQTREYGLYLQQLALNRDEQGNIEESEYLHKDVVSIFEQAGGRASYDTAEALWHFSRFYILHDKLIEAEAILHELAEMTETDIGVRPLERVAYLQDYACVLDELGKAEQAEAIRRKAQSVRQEYEREMEEDD